MAKGKYKKWLEPDNLLRLQAWARNGLTDEQIAGNMDISMATLYNYKKAHLDILEALKRGKEVVDIEVENALKKKALGFKETVMKAIKVKTVEYENGRRVKEYEEVVQAEDEVYIAPDTTAQIFWLKNRMPGAWRDKKDKELSGNVDINLILDEVSDE